MRAQLTLLRHQEPRINPQPLVLQQGSQRAHPDELTHVSDSGV
ncbi:hypothetical protein ABQG65_11530 [Yersinia alsatica]